MRMHKCNLSSLMVVITPFFGANVRLLLLSLLLLTCLGARASFQVKCTRKALFFLADEISPLMSAVFIALSEFRG